ncbi:hypothetical protein [Streptomyces prunicolor]|uniref:hypothetical protein n=1 Tax=Streptomyces prunicolor TaxID=67348 RepID=UPI00037D47EE|nr:hypothetical protein [Streptomyces prunicolor]
MSSVGIQFAGGPVDGQLLAIPADPWNPPHTCELRNADGYRLVYRRHVNPADDGPLWLYRYEGTARREERAT